VADLGYVGLGVMGSAITRRLLDAGHAITVWNRTREKAEPLLASAPRAALATIELRAIADNSCTRDPQLATLTERIGVDELLATSRIDRVETELTPWTRTGEHATEAWRVAAAGAQNHAWLAVNPHAPSDTQLVSPPLQVSTTEPFVLSISHAYSMAAAYDIVFDGAVIELSRDDGATWTDVSELGVDPGYTGQVFPGFQNPLEGRPVFAGTSPGFPNRQRLRLEFGAQFAGQVVRVRFRAGASQIAGGAGWTIDDLEVQGTVNTPFPELAAEPSTCTASAAAVGDSAVLAVHRGPAANLDAFDTAACIATEQ